MAGLIGSSNSPVSGLAILTVLGASLLLLALAKPSDPAAGKALVAFALFVTAVILNVATISNDNLQDLKTGQLVGATPWRQQLALVFGVIFGAIVIPPVLDLLNRAYGFAGSPMHGITAQPLAAPQATLISALANGVITGQLPWNLIGLGALVGIAIVVVDEVLRRTARRQFPPLAVALGIYLPMSVTAMVVVGAFAGKAYDRWASARRNPDVARRLGVLLASGLIVGESLFGVILSASSSRRARTSRSRCSASDRRSRCGARSSARWHSSPRCSRCTAGPGARRSASERMTHAQSLARALNALAKSPQFSYTKARAAARQDPNVDWPATKAENADFNPEVDGCETFVMRDRSVCAWNSASFTYVARSG